MLDVVHPTHLSLAKMFDTDGCNDSDDAIVVGGAVGGDGCFFFSL